MEIDIIENQSEPLNSEDSLKPLVSIVVVTYNSAKFVLETLESTKAQSYPNLELIVSDDCSTDNTLEICKDWLEKNKERFTRTELLTVAKNTGIPSNCNRGFNAAKGEWIKGIAGDDILFENCVSDNIEFVGGNNTIKICQSLAKEYYNTFEEKNFYKLSTNSNHPFGFLTSSQQYKLLQYKSFPKAPTMFINRLYFLDIGMFDEDFPLEDWPFWLKITKNKGKIYQFNKATVGYRIHSKSAFHQIQDKTLFTNYYLTDRLVHNKLVLGYCTNTTKFFINYKHYIRVFFEKLGLNRRNKFLAALFLIMNTPYTIHLKYLESKFKPAPRESNEN